MGEWYFASGSTGNAVSTCFGWGHTFRLTPPICWPLPRVDIVVGDWMLDLLHHGAAILDLTSPLWDGKVDLF